MASEEFSGVTDSDLLGLTKEEFDQCWDDAVVDPASTDQELSDIARLETIKTSAPAPGSFQLKDWPGDYLFNIKLEEGSGPKQRRDCQYSKSLNKLFICQNKYIDIKLLYSVDKSKPSSLSVSACLMFSSPEFAKEHVRVCYQHSHNSDGQLKELMASHILRLTTDVDNTDVKYLTFPSGRHLARLDNLPVATTTNYQETPIRIKFMDLSSCPGGINRRDTCLVLALTDASGTCLGRKMLPVRVCSQPKRDRANEEESFKSTNLNDINILPQATDQENNDEDAQYWVMASNKKNFDALMVAAERLEELSGTDMEKWKEEIKTTNNSLRLAGSKKRKFSKLDL